MVRQDAALVIGLESRTGLMKSQGCIRKGDPDPPARPRPAASFRWRLRIWQRTQLVYLIGSWLVSSSPRLPANVRWPDGILIIINATTTLGRWSGACIDGSVFRIVRYVCVSPGAITSASWVLRGTPAVHESQKSKSTVRKTDHVLEHDSPPMTHMRQAQDRHAPCQPTIRPIHGAALVETCHECCTARAPAVPDACYHVPDIGCFIYTRFSRCSRPQISNTGILPPRGGVVTTPCFRPSEHLPKPQFHNSS